MNGIFKFIIFIVDVSSNKQYEIKESEERSIIDHLSSSNENESVWTILTSNVYSSIL